jgi:hypothetical protein
MPSYHHENAPAPENAQKLCPKSSAQTQCSYAKNTAIQSHARYHSPRETMGARRYIDRLPLGPRHAGAAYGTAYAVSALERRNAHHIRVSLGWLVLVLEADVLVAVVPGSDAAQQSRSLISRGIRVEVGEYALVVGLDVHLGNQLVVVFGGQVVCAGGYAEGGQDEQRKGGGAHGPRGIEDEAGEEAGVVVEDV